MVWINLETMEASPGPKVPEFVVNFSYYCLTKLDETKLVFINLYDDPNVIFDWKLETWEISPLKQMKSNTFGLSCGTYRSKYPIVVSTNSSELWIYTIV